MRMLRAADLIGSRTEAEAYMRVAAERYRLIRTHEWNDEIIERLRRKVRIRRRGRVALAGSRLDVARPGGVRSSRLRLTGLGPVRRGACIEPAPPSSPASDRLRPVAGSKMCSRPDVHPELGVLALADRGGRRRAGRRWSRRCRRCPRARILGQLLEFGGVHPSPELR